MPAVLLVGLAGFVVLNAAAAWSMFQAARHLAPGNSGEFWRVLTRGVMLGRETYSEEGWRYRNSAVRLSMGGVSIGVLASLWYMV